MIDYLSLDIEGGEESVLMPFPFERYTFRALSIERPTSKLESHVLSKGYAFVRAHGDYGDCMYMYAHVATVGYQAIAAHRRGDNCTWDTARVLTG